MQRRFLLFFIFILLLAISLGSGLFIGYILGQSNSQNPASTEQNTSTSTSETSRTTTSVTSQATDEPITKCVYDEKVMFELPLGWWCTHGHQNEDLSYASLESDKYSISIGFLFGVPCGEGDPDCEITTVIDSNIIDVQTVLYRGSGELLGFFKNQPQQIGAGIRLTDKKADRELSNLTAEQIADIKPILDTARYLP